MKKVIYLALSFSLLFFSNSCKKIEEEINEFTQFTMEFDESTPFVAPYNLPVGTYPVPMNDIETNNDALFAANNTARNLLEKAILREATMTLREGDFGFLESVEIYISDVAFTSTDVVGVLIASKTNISATSTVDLDTEDINLVEYLKKDMIHYKVIMTTDEVVPAGTSLNIDFHSKFFIDAKILGL